MYANKAALSTTDSPPQEINAELVDLAQSISRMQEEFDALVATINPVLSQEKETNGSTGRPYATRQSPLAITIQEQVRRVSDIADYIEAIHGRTRL